MKKNLFCGLLLVALFVTNAQAQTITDADFAAAIAEACPTCITGNVLQPPAKTLKDLNISHKSIKNLTGINGFTTLTSLDCGSNQLTSLPELPNSLTKLYCGDNQLEELPKTLPTSLQELFCINNKLTSLPKTLPTLLTYLECSGNKLTILPQLPSSMQELYCYNNQLLSLPTPLPKSLKELGMDASITCIPNEVAGLKITDKDNKVITRPFCFEPLIPDAKFAAAIASVCPTCIKGNVLQPAAKTLKSLDVSSKNIDNLTGIGGFTWLKELSCNKNQLKSLPPLPEFLATLNCSGNQLKSLPKLNEYLKELDCVDNQLTSLPELSGLLVTLNCSGNKLTGLPRLFGSLTTLICNWNQLKELPPLPASLIMLYCNNNKLKNLPPLPATLKGLSCFRNNDLSSLPQLPASLTTLFMDYSIGCIPNQVAGLTITDQFTKVMTRPLCDTPKTGRNFNGSSEFVSLNTSIATGLSNGRAVTIEYWFKGTNLQSAVRLQGSSGYIVAGWGGTPMHIISTDGGLNGVNINALNGINVHDNQWHHIAMTWEINKTDGFKSYLDGLLVAKRTSGINNLPNLIGVTPVLGAYINGNARSEFTKGQLARVRIWKAARTDDEIKANRDKDLPANTPNMLYQGNGN